MAKKKTTETSKKSKTKSARVIFNPDTLMFQKTTQTKEGPKVDTSMHLEYCHTSEPDRNYWVRLVKLLHGYRTPKGEVKPMRFYWEIVKFAPKTHIIYNEGNEALSVNVEASIQTAKETLQRVNQMLRDEGYIMEPFVLEERDRTGKQQQQKTLGFETLGFLRKYKQDR